MHFPSSTFDEGACAEDVLKNISTLEYDLVICDLSMPGRSGLDVLKQVKETKPKLPVLILSMHPDEHYAVRAIKAGAWGYVNKSDGAEVLIPAIQRIVQGRKFIPDEIAQLLAGNLTIHDAGEDRLHENLSGREFDIFKLLVEGKSISDIAQQLSLGLSTVSTHRARILTKMNMKSNAELVKYAIQNNLI